jgi:hypothetical protein
MKALKVMASLDEQGQLTLDHPLPIDQKHCVAVIF